MTILLVRHGETAGDAARILQRLAAAFDFVVSRRCSVNGNLVVITHGLVCRALVGRHALLSEGVAVPQLFNNTSVTVLHEKAPHAVSLLNCTRHLT
jgi:probable phosphoglycerate mutase